MSSWLFLAWALVGSVWDIREKKVPLAWVVGGVIAAVLIFALCRMPEAILSEEFSKFLYSTVLSLLPGLFLLSVCFLSRGAVGQADGWYLLVLGGVQGFPEACGSLIGGVFLAGIAACGGLILRKVGRKSRLPLLPFLTAAWGIGRLLKFFP